VTGPRLRVVALVAAVLAALAVGAPPSAAQSALCPWLGSSKPPDQRAREVLAQMTLAEKLAMVREPAGYTVPFGAAGWIPSNPRLCIPALVMQNAGAGVGDVQTQTTPFPAPIAQAAAWDPALQREVGAAIGAETWGKGADVLLGPGIEIDRTPLNGRNFEYFSEDPFLAGQTAAAEVSGIQSHHVIATVKHFIANSQETNRNTVSADVDARTLQEVYAPPYEAAVREGHAGAVMCAYNRVNGTYSCENPATLTGLLKDQFGFPGFVMSDWGATQSTVASANAGLDMEMNNTPGTYYGAPLLLALESGQVPMARLDDMVRRILRSMFAVGVFDHPPAGQPAAYATNVSTPAHRALARRAAEQGAVLLKDERAVLPYEGRGQTIGVIGDAASQLGAEYTYGGGGSSHVPLPAYDPVKSPLQAIQDRARRNGDQVLYDEGFDTSQAVSVARRSDIVFVFANDGETEGQDRPDLHLHPGSCNVFCVQPGGDVDAQIAAIAAANPRTVAVLETGGPVVMPWLDKVRGVLEVWYPGGEGADAIAALLFGDAAPGGRLPETFPRSQADLPTNRPQRYPGTDDAAGVPHAVYSEGVFVGYRWYDARGIAPLFPFGFGLSYTRFRYADLRVSGSSVSFTVTNTGSRRGNAVPQVYMHLAGAPEPPRQLRGYAKVSLAPGRSARVRIALGPRAFSYWSTAARAWVVAPGCHTISVGSSSRDLPLSAPSC
jgi:beta-glucosidase